MVASMTGYGQAARTVAGFRVQVELKSVNHRYCEVAVRIPREFARIESAVKAIVQQQAKRGRIDVFVTIERDRDAAQTPRVDWTLAEGYRDAAEQLRARFALEQPLSLRDLLSIPGIVSFGDRPEIDDDAMETEVAGCVEDAVRAMCVMRMKEGDFLREDLLRKVGVLEAFGAEAARIAPQVVKEYAEKLRLRMQELLQPTSGLDDSRLAMEAAVFADRVGIDEELTRLRSHAFQFRELLQESEPVGRKLDFLVQEMNREINTIGSKANHAALAALVVEMKAELEKMREQIQNIE